MYRSVIDLEVKAFMLFVMSVQRIGITIKGYERSNSFAEGKQLFTSVVNKCV